MVCAVEAVKALGCVIVTVLVNTVPSPLVIVQVYVPAVKLLAVAAVPPDGDHA